MKKKIRTAKSSCKAKTKNGGDGTRLAVRIGYAGSAAAEISGDAAISCGLPDGSRALILSDGMGRGIKAAAGSRMVVSRLRKNLKEGMPVARAINEVNRHMIDCACDEGFATVDLIIIDPRLCRAKFYKMGAGASFLVRGSRVRRIVQGALPVGIIPRLRLTHISAGLQPGDVIVAASDGITEADRNDLKACWLSDYLSDYFRLGRRGNMSPRRAAADILQQALIRYDGREQDDLTVAVVVLNNEEQDFTDNQKT